MVIKNKIYKACPFDLVVTVVNVSRWPMSPEPKGAVGAAPLLPEQCGGTGFLFYMNYTFYIQAISLKFESEIPLRNVIKVSNYTKNVKKDQLTSCHVVLLTSSVCLHSYGHAIIRIKLFRSDVLTLFQTPTLTLTLIFRAVARGYRLGGWWTSNCRVTITRYAEFFLENVNDLY
jgi:hypothetical protein